VCAYTLEYICKPHAVKIYKSLTDEKCNDTEPITAAQSPINLHSADRIVVDWLVSAAID
jgi:hypothetical protein